MTSTGGARSDLGSLTSRESLETTYEAADLLAVDLVEVARAYDALQLTVDRWRDGEDREAVSRRRCF